MKEKNLEKDGDNLFYYQTIEKQSLPMVWARKTNTTLWMAKKLTELSPREKRKLRRPTLRWKIYIRTAMIENWKPKWVKLNEEDETFPSKNVLGVARNPIPESDNILQNVVEKRYYTELSVIYLTSIIFSWFLQASTKLLRLLITEKRVLIKFLCSEAMRSTKKLRFTLSISKNVIFKSFTT